MKGTALEANELRLGAVGDKTSWFGDLVGLVREWDTLISSEVGEVLSQLERRRALMNDSTPGGFFHSAELFLQSGVEGCEAAALRLIELVRECPTATHANGMQVTQLSLQDEDSGESKVVPLSTALLEDKVRRSVDAAITDDFPPAECPMATTLSLFAAVLTRAQSTKADTAFPRARCVNARNGVSVPGCHDRTT
jgi:hypothetical protein